MPLFLEHKLDRCKVFFRTSRKRDQQDGEKEEKKAVLHLPPPVIDPNSGGFNDRTTAVICPGSQRVPAAGV